MKDELKADQLNANKGTARGRELLVRSLRELGAGRSILADKDGNLIAGNKTFEAAQELGLRVRVVETDGSELVVVKRTDLDLTERTGKARELAYADNRVAEIDLQWEAEQLAADMEAGMDLNALFGEKDLKEIMGALYPEEEKDAEPQFDRAEELREKWGVETGQLWELGEHRLICGDCTDAAVVEKVMGGEKATLMFTDPPYGVSIGAKNRMLNSFQKAGMNLTDIESDQDCAEDLGDMLLKAFRLSKDFLAEDCSVFVCSPQGGSLGMMMMMMRDAGLEVRHVLNWIKNSPTFSMGRLDYDYQHEPILFTWIKKHKRIMAGEFKTSTWAIDKPSANKEHPTMKPVELYKNAILNHTDKNDICYDPFLGSGTAIIACENLKRKCRAVEISAAYVAVALQRYLDATGIEPRRVG